MSEANVVSYFCRHLVSVLISYQILNDPTEQDRFQAYSGYAIELDGRYFLFSAGHVIKNIVDSIRSNHIIITSTKMGDVFSINSRSNVPVPINLRGSRYFYVDDEDCFLDFGFIEISDYYVRLMKENGIEIPNLSHCRDDREEGYSGFLMLGLPEEGVSQELDKAGNAVITPTLVPVERVPPSTENETRAHQFIGRIPRLGNLSSIVGMSGGPIFGLQLVDGRYKYWLVATQSSWERSSGLVYAMPILPIMKYFDQIGYNSTVFDQI